MSTARTVYILDQVTHKNPLGDIFILSIDDLVVNSGLYGKLWDIPFDMIKHYVMSHSWIYATIEFNNKYNISLSVKHGVLKLSIEKR